VSKGLLATFLDAIKKVEKYLKTAKRHYTTLKGTFYAERVPEAIAEIHRAFLQLKGAHADDAADVVAEIGEVEKLVDALTSMPAVSPVDLLAATRALYLRTYSKLAAILPGATTGKGTVFLAEDLLEKRHGPLRKVLWEANECYNRECYNACATMIRRLIEALLIEAFEAKTPGANIKEADGQTYLGLGALIDRAITESKFKLSSSTRKVLPDLKFFGDVAAHNPRVLVRERDLSTRYRAVRVAVEELVFQTRET
jgi:hypothetical protein